VIPPSTGITARGPSTPDDGRGRENDRDAKPSEVNGAHDGACATERNHRGNAEGRLPLLGHLVDKDPLKTMLNALGVSERRAEIVALLKDEPLTYLDVRAKVGRLKSVSQWKTKLTSFGCEKANEFTSLTVTGDAIYRHLDLEGVWARVPLQGYPQMD
jgi:hypothetical protein